MPTFVIILVKFMNFYTGMAVVMEHADFHSNLGKMLATSSVRAHVTTTKKIMSIGMLAASTNAIIHYHHTLTKENYSVAIPATIEQKFYTGIKHASKNAMTHLIIALKKVLNSVIGLVSPLNTMSIGMAPATRLAPILLMYTMIQWQSTANIDVNIRTFYTGIRVALVSAPLP